MSARRRVESAYEQKLGINAGRTVPSLDSAPSSIALQSEKNNNDAPVLVVLMR